VHNCDWHKESGPSNAFTPRQAPPRAPVPVRDGLNARGNGPNAALYRQASTALEERCLGLEPRWVIPTKDGVKNCDLHVQYARRNRYERPGQETARKIMGGCTKNDRRVAGYAGVCLRRKYISPKLTDFGRVRELTTGGSFGNSENGMGYQTMKSRP